MAVINHSVIIRNWGLGIGTIYLTVAVPIFSNCRKSFITPNGLLYRLVYAAKSGIYEKRHVVCRNQIIQNGGYLHTAFAGSIPLKINGFVSLLNPTKTVTTGDSLDSLCLENFFQ